MPRCILITGSMISPEAACLLNDNQLEAIVLPGIPTRGDIAEAIRRHQAAGLIVRTGKIDDEVLSASPSLRVVVKHGVGIDNIDLNAANQYGIAVMITHGANTRSVAEHTLALMLSVAKQLNSLDQGLRSGRWDKSRHQGIELTGKSIALIGFGQIARHVAKLLAPFDMNIRAFVRHSPENAADHDIDFTQKLDEALAAADVVSIHCPLTPSTHGLISTKQLELMKPSAMLVNTARGGIVDELALVTALKTGKLAGAGLDCYESEPLSIDNELLSLPNVVLTPHIGWATKEATVRMGHIAVRNILSILDNSTPDMDCLINPSVLS